MHDFAQIYSEYYSVVYNYMVSLCHDEYLAEEVTQEAFFKAIKNINRFRGDCKLDVWLCQIAKNTYYTIAKRKMRCADFPLEIISTDTDIETTLVNQETVLELHKVLHSLNEPYKEVFWMRTFGELSFLQIGELLKKSESWARVTYHRAKIKIKEELK